MITYKKERLEKIWKDYTGKFEDFPNIKTLIEHGFVHSKVESKKVLFTGINPSDDGVQYDLKDSYEAEYFDVHKAVTGYKKYYKKFQDIADHCGIGKEWTYLDLFYFRETEQGNLNMLLKNDTSLQFLCKQLALTQEILEELNPNLIVVLNKRSHEFWGKNTIDENGKLSMVWMGYEFEDVQFDGFKNDKETGELKKIKGLINSEGRVSKEKIAETKLKGTLVYFSSFFKYEKTEIKENIKKNIKKIIESDVFKNRK